MKGYVLPITPERPGVRFYPYRNRHTNTNTTSAVTPAGSTMRHGHKRARAHSKSDTKSRKRRKISKDSSSTGDMNKVVYKKPKVSKKKIKKQKRFQRKVERVLESEMPVIKRINPTAFTITWAKQKQALVVIPERDVSALRQMLQEITQAAPAVGTTSEKYWWTGHSVQGFYSNIGNALAVLDWYTVVPKHNSVNDCQSDFSQYANTNYTAGGEALYTGQSTTFTATDFGLQPYDMSLWCQNWTILSQRRVLLQPGETKDFRFNSKKRLHIDVSKLQEGGTFYSCVKGITKYHFIIAYGQPAQDTTNNVQGTSPGRVNFAFTYRYSGQAVPSNISTTKAAASVLTCGGLLSNGTFNPSVTEELNPAAFVAATTN